MRNSRRKPDPLASGLIRQVGGRSTGSIHSNARRSLAENEQIARANALYREFHAQCFWHCPPDLVIDEAMVSFVVKGLRTHGGHRGFMLAAELAGS